MADVRILRFDGANRQLDEQRFSLLRSGFVAGGNRAERKGMEVTRREGVILDLFDTVSDRETDETLQFTDVQRRALLGIGVAVASLELYVLRPGPQTISLDASQYDLLKKYFDATPWRTELAKRATDVYDWLCDVKPERTI